MKFILVFYITSFFLSVIIWKIADGSMGFVFPVLLFNLLYFITTFFIWYATNRWIKGNSLVNFFLKYLIGFLTLNLLFFFIFNNFPLFILFEADGDQGRWRVSLFIHVIYSLSFVTAFFTKSNKKNTDLQLPNL
jgi:hypothetical protein